MIAKWKAKAIVQKAISYLPYKEKINYLFQRYVTKGVLLNEEHFTWKLTHASDHLQFFRDLNQSIKGQKVLELGTGWYPIVPIAFYLSGVESFSSIDISSWMNRESQLLTIATFVDWEKEGRLEPLLANIQEKRWQQLIDIHEHPEKYPTQESINQVLHFQPFIQDARQTTFASQSFDLICSNNTFEHIYPEILEPILQEFKRLLKKGGAMSHFVDLSDHFAHFDHSINIYNFLRFDEQQWRRIDNSIQPQNRLRWRDYEAMYQRLAIPFTNQKVRPGNLEALARIPLSEQYADYAQEELAISHGYLVSA